MRLKAWRHKWRYGEDHWADATLDVGPFQMWVSYSPDAGWFAAVIVGRLFSVKIS